MKRRLEKKIERRMSANPREGYSTAKLLVLAQERRDKVQFRTTLKEDA